MNTQAQPTSDKMTPEEYLTLERNSIDIKHEYFGGEVFAMVGASRNHNRININLTSGLDNRFEADKSACDLFSNDMRVKIKDSYVYPDLVISCGAAEFEGNEFDTLINPVVIMEILSDSTESFDRGDKFAYYRAIPSLKEYILVSQKKYRVEQFIRSNDNGWKYFSYEGIDQIVKMGSVNCDLFLSKIYRNVEF